MGCELLAELTETRDIWVESERSSKNPQMRNREVEWSIPLAVVQSERLQENLSLLVQRGPLQELLLEWIEGIGRIVRLDCKPLEWDPVALRLELRPAEEGALSLEVDDHDRMGSVLGVPISNVC